MSRLSFDHQQKKRKTWLFPLIVIILLYISIPYLLINSGSNAIDSAFAKMGNKAIELPEKQYSTGIVLISFAEMFPGFTNWSKRIKEKSNEKMLVIYKQKYSEKSIKLFKKISNYEQEFDSLSVKYEHNEVQTYMNVIIYKEKEKENLKILIPNEEKTNLQNDFCSVWADFFKKAKMNVPNSSVCPI